MSYFCHTCQSELKLTEPVGRTETCLKCNADLKCCLNCTHYDTTAYNECHEPNAERVLEKSRSNFCDYFSFAQNQKNNLSPKPDLARKQLEELFRKK